MAFELRNIPAETWDRFTARAECEGWDVRNLVTQLMRDYGEGAIAPSVTQPPAVVLARRIVNGHEWLIEGRPRRIKFGSADLEPDPSLMRMTFRYEGDPADRFTVIVPMEEATRDPGWVQNQVMQWLQQAPRTIGSRLILPKRNL